MSGAIPLFPRIQEQNVTSFLIVQVRSELSPTVMLDGFAASVTIGRAGVGVGVGAGVGAGAGVGPGPGDGGAGGGPPLAQLPVAVTTTSPERVTPFWLAVAMTL
ncbi:MAG: hypothetical protein A3D49_02615 [Candidatus Zambryskibacteria bacterium RIFCSPHIGHO2_02_FULL_43_37]|uniref:Uncharacterized protein n=1 Tax=Candidatus Zambryskibacteria bacterium RIFCSPHIGHO2_02_FULL_43_37 TaxID=1802749 RepID=A0A1G2THN8_9BACT|nr:MAG: hypothetical protein A3D49_02615 [Candidatus Zambryskibacteria bacterium RIFCSPHIGHO2_02_FULL_43_37]